MPRRRFTDEEWLWLENIWSSREVRELVAKNAKRDKAPEGRGKRGRQQKHEDGGLKAAASYIHTEFVKVFDTPHVDELEADFVTRRKALKLQGFSAQRTIGETEEAFQARQPHLFKQLYNWCVSHSPNKATRSQSFKLADIFKEPPSKHATAYSLFLEGHSSKPAGIVSAEGSKCDIGAWSAKARAAFDALCAEEKQMLQKLAEQENTVDVTGDEEVSEVMRAS
ncbi:hypothetical protein PHLCEN_2v3428 [Hermanssonia centrifuga]|uniref:Uncharacterized protein n=1 Tax=Hermanssonia centrifuga TaxID=98765 RepID=A0A2R6QIS3_9APHY|nr:hypothetical protein PHLCEN_2v3428 [Hermanssonia centrifuga]